MDIIRDFWQLIVAGVAAFIWLIRLEARGIANSAEVRRLWAQRKEDLASSEARRAEDRASAKESRDRVDARLDVIGSDVKQLLRGLGK